MESVITLCIRGLASMLKRAASGLESLSIGPEAQPSAGVALDALRRRYPGAPDHWLAYIAERSPEFAELEGRTEEPRQRLRDGKSSKTPELELSVGEDQRLMAIAGTRAMPAPVTHSPTPFRWSSSRLPAVEAGALRRASIPQDGRGESASLTPTESQVDHPELIFAYPINSAQPIRQDARVGKECKASTSRPPAAHLLLARQSLRLAEPSFRGLAQTDTVGISSHGGARVSREVHHAPFPDLPNHLGRPDGPSRAIDSAGWPRLPPSELERSQPPQEGPDLRRLQAQQDGDVWSA